MSSVEPASAAPPTAGTRAVRRAVFVDRDGTLNPDLHYLKESSRLEVFDGVSEGIRLLRAHGYLVLCVTNQSGIERGFYTEADVLAIHRRLNEILAKHGARVDAFYYCPHAPETQCLCRKPGTELFERAQREWQVEFDTSAVVGDRALDVQAGEKLGLLTAVVPQPGGALALAEELHRDRLVPDIWAPSFRAAAARILQVG